MTVRLQNQGQRTIHFGSGKLEPKAVGVFNNDTAANLLRLFPKELADIDNLTVDVQESEMQDFSSAKKGPKAKAAPKGADKDAALADALAEEKSAE